MLARHAHQRFPSKSFVSVIVLAERSDTALSQNEERLHPQPQNLDVTLKEYEDMIRPLASAIISYQALLAIALPWQYRDT
jgi:hypothetical protein